MNKPVLTERIMASEALRAEYVQDVIHWLADQWSMDRALNEYGAKSPDFGIIWPASDKPMAPHGSTNNHARRKHPSPPAGIPGIHVKNDSQQGTCTASSVPPRWEAAVFLGDAPNTPVKAVAS